MSERLREGWWAVFEGTEGRMEAGREEEAGQQVTPPLDSANHQSRCWWRFRLRTERTSAVNLGEREGGHLNYCTFHHLSHESNSST